MKAQVKGEDQSRAQLEKKELPQSGNPVSDFTLDGLKHIINPPSRV